MTIHGHEIIDPGAVDDQALGATGEVKPSTWNGQVGIGRVVHIDADVQRCERNTAAFFPAASGAAQCCR